MPENQMVRYIVTGNKVTDLSILPKAMIPFCEGRDTYWMQADDGQKTGKPRDTPKPQVWATHMLSAVLITALLSYLLL